MIINEKECYKVPSSLQELLMFLYGMTSKDSSLEYRTKTEWVTLFKKINDDLYNYIETNIDTDFIHFSEIIKTLYNADKSLTEDFFWPDYINGLIRIILLLIGDIPDHFLRKGGRKERDHYSLKRTRSVSYCNNSDQKIQLIYKASKHKLAKLSKTYREFNMEFRKSEGFKATNNDFIRWFQVNYPSDYAKLF